MRFILLLSFFYLSIGIALGAFGAHGLRGYFIGREEEIWKTAVFYQLISALGMLAIVLLQKNDLVDSKAASVSSKLLASGVIIFSGSLYLLVLSRQAFFGAITPIGGTLLIVAWLYLACSELFSGKVS